jgi:hypothetical protein
MINMMATPPVPAGNDATLQTLSDMLRVLSDPAGSKERVSEMQAATAELQRASQDQKAAMAALIVAESQHNAAIVQKTADANDKLAADRSAFDAECKRRSDELTARENNAAELQSQAAADAKAAAALRSDYERRLKIIRSATG